MTFVLSFAFRNVITSYSIIVSISVILFTASPCAPSSPPPPLPLSFWMKSWIEPTPSQLWSDAYKLCYQPFGSKVVRSKVHVFVYLYTSVLCACVHRLRLFSALFS